MNLAAIGSGSSVGTTSNFEDKLSAPQQPQVVQSAVTDKWHAVETGLLFRFDDTRTFATEFGAGLDIKGRVSYDSRKNLMTATAVNTDGISETVQFEWSKRGEWKHLESLDTKPRKGLIALENKNNYDGAPRKLTIGNAKIALEENNFQQSKYHPGTNTFISSESSPNGGAAIVISSGPEHNGPVFSEVPGVHAAETLNVLSHKYNANNLENIFAGTTAYRPTLPEHEKPIDAAIKVLNNNPKIASADFQAFEKVFEGLEGEERKVFSARLQTAMSDKLLSSNLSTFSSYKPFSYLRNSETDRANNALELMKLSFAPSDLVEATRLVFGQDEGNPYVNEAQRYFKSRNW